MRQNCPPPVCACGGGVGGRFSRDGGRSAARAAGKSCSHRGRPPHVQQRSPPHSVLCSSYSRPACLRRAQTLGGHQRVAGAAGCQSGARCAQRAAGVVGARPHGAIAVGLRIAPYRAVLNAPLAMTAMHWAAFKHAPMWPRQTASSPADLTFNSHRLRLYHSCPTTGISSFHHFSCCTHSFWMLEINLKGRRICDRWHRLAPAFARCAAVMGVPSACSTRPPGSTSMSSFLERARCASAEATA